MKYVQVENGQVINFNLPKVGYLKDGRTVSGYDLLDEETLKNEGWLPLVEEMPPYDTKIQYIQHDGYTVELDRVISKYIAVSIPVPEPQPYIPTQEERLKATEEGLMAMMEVMG